MTQLDPSFGLRRQARAAGFALREFAFPGGHRMPRHDHAHPVIVLMFGGVYRGHAGRDDYQIGPGEWLVAPAAGNHAGAVGADGSRAVLIEPLAERTGTLERAGLDRLCTYGQRGLRHLARRIDRELSATDRAAPLALEAALLDLLATLGRVQHPSPAEHRDGWVQTARDLVEARLAGTFRVTDLARQLAVSPSRLHRAFRGAFQCSIGEYVRARRLERAAELLRGSERSLSDIAVSAGFYDQSHLTNAFRARYGVTPGRFRAEA